MVQTRSNAFFVHHFDNVKSSGKECKNQIAVHIGIEDEKSLVNVRRWLNIFSSARQDSIYAHRTCSPHTDNILTLL